MHPPRSIECTCKATESSPPRDDSGKRWHLCTCGDRHREPPVVRNASAERGGWPPFVTTSVFPDVPARSYRRTRTSFLSKHATNNALRLHNFEGAGVVKYSLRQGGERVVVEVQLCDGRETLERPRRQASKAAAPDVAAIGCAEFTGQGAEQGQHVNSM